MTTETRIKRGVTPEDRLRDARESLCTKQHFWGSLALNLSLQEMKDNEYPEWAAHPKTLATNGKKLLWHPEFVKACTQESQLEMGIAHEIAHVMFFHCFPPPEAVGMENLGVWRMAQEHVVNNLLLDSNFDLAQMPPTVKPVCDRKYQGWSTEEVYQDLMKGKQTVKMQMQGPGGGPGCTCIVEIQGKDGEAPTQAELDQIKSQIQDQMAEAARIAKQMGTLPGNLERLVDDLLDPVVPWPQKVRRILATAGKEDVNWRRPSRRNPNADKVYLPSRQGYGVPCIVIAVDTSGSCWGPEIQTRFASEAKSIFEDLSVEVVHVVYSDCVVTKVDTYRRGDQLEFVLDGGGGTSFKPVFQWVEENNIQPNALIYLTDMEGDFPTEDPGYQTIWACYGPEHSAPFGEVIRVDI
jgi:predicted metal-dependent peptidase